MARAFGGRILAPDDERALAREERAGVSPRVCCALLLVLPGFCCSVCSFPVRSLRSKCPYRVRTKAITQTAALQGLLLAPMVLGVAQ